MNQRLLPILLKNRQILAVGMMLSQMFGRTPGSIVAAGGHWRTVLLQIIQSLEAMVSYFLKKPLKGLPGGLTWWFLYPEARLRWKNVRWCLLGKNSGTWCLPYRRATHAAAIDSYSFQASGHMIVNVGGGTAEIAVTNIQWDSWLCTKAFEGLERSLMRAIMLYLRKKYNIIIGEDSWRCKDRWNAFLDSAKKIVFIEVKGAWFSKQVCRKVVQVNEKAVSEALQKPLKGILERGKGGAFWNTARISLRYCR